MEVRRNRVSTSVRTEGGLLPADLLAKIAAAEPDVPGLKDTDFGLAAGERFREAITRSWNRLVGAWAALEAVRVAAEETDALTGTTRDRFLMPLFEELGFGRLPVARRAEIDGTTYPISHLWGDRVPVHLVGFGVDLDSRSKGVRGAAGAAPHALVQDFLNRTDWSLWGLVSNGRTLRLLRDSTSLTRQAYVEFDLDAIFTGELYADFALLWSVCHRSRFEGDRPGDCLLERWTKKAADDGTRALDKLRGGVENAIETLGAGFLAHPANGALRDALRSGALDRQDYYRELLRLVYRLIFLFTAEDRRDETSGRELLLDPVAPDEAARRYRAHYSTARLRSFASHRRGTRHPDLWVGLRRVMAALGRDGAPTLALPALGSFLFGAGACPHLDGADLRNEDLLDGVRALATIEEDRRLRLVDYRNLGAEELGGIYEGLLELHPRIEVEANPPRFSLGSAVGNERKSTGSYYTPTSLISCLLDSALDPVVDEAVKGKAGREAEAAILALAVVDPAAGSGHFLVAAAHRLAKRLAAVRSGEGEPPPAQVRRALRDVISRCIYAVDINPMAVELCKVSLWLEALEPGRPLSFLDAHVRCGNSLLGTTPELAAGGVPDAAFEAISGDDKAVARDWRKVNAAERAGQYSLFGADLTDPVRPLAAEARALEELPEDSAANVAEKAARHNAYLASAAHIRAKSALDAWCAAFVAPKAHGSPAVTTATVRSLGTGGAAVGAPAREMVERTAAVYAFFHWPLEFPAVFERGGFDVVLGNPPWERIKLQEQEFFSERSPAIAGARNAAERKRMIAKLEVADPALWGEFRHGLRRSDGESHFLRNSGHYPLSGKGDINTYAVFAELTTEMVRPTGLLGLVIPSGIATDDTTKDLFSALVTPGRLVSLFDFVNDRGYFPGVGHGRQKFCLLTAGGTSRLDAEPDFCFFAHTVDDLHLPGKVFSLTASDLALLNPNTRTCPTFQSDEDARITKLIYRTVPVLVREGDEHGNPWSIAMGEMVHMANDSGMFTPVTGPIHEGSGLYPVWEAKMVQHYNHRRGDYAMRPAGSRDSELPAVPEDRLRDPAYQVSPQYAIARKPIDERLGDWTSDWHLVWRKICRSTDVRTLIPAILPRGGVANSAITVSTVRGPVSCLVANLSSFVADYCTRQKLGGTNLAGYVTKQLPVLPPDAYTALTAWTPPSQTVGEWLRYRVVELTFTAWDIRGFAIECGWNGGPFAWDTERRDLIRAEVDAAMFLLYGVSRDDLLHVMDSFPIVQRNDEQVHLTYRTRDLILDAYDTMAAATPDRPFVSRLDPPPGDPRAAHPPRPGEQPGHWIPWPEVLARARHSAPTARTVRVAAAPPANLNSVGRASRTPEPAPSLFVTDPALAWQTEAAIAPSEIAIGARVRHRTKGEGTVLAVRQTGRSTELLIRFDATGEALMGFGYGVLEFQR